jgi:hypothetical protein
MCEMKEKTDNISAEGYCGHCQMIIDDLRANAEK